MRHLFKRNTKGGGDPVDIITGFCGHIVKRVIGHHDCGGDIVEQFVEQSVARRQVFYLKPLQHVIGFNTRDDIGQLENAVWGI